MRQMCKGGSTSFSCWASRRFAAFSQRTASDTTDVRGAFVAKVTGGVVLEEIVVILGTYRHPLNSVGVQPVCFLKNLLKLVTSLKSRASDTSETV